MEAKKKYSAPALKAVAVSSEGIICDSNHVMIWSLSTPSSLSTAEEWSRADYGSANEI